jgi:hypothetical protein
LSRFLPLTGLDRSPIRNLLFCLDSLWSALRSFGYVMTDIDDFSNIRQHLQNYQTTNRLRTGRCDVETAAFLFARGSCETILPVFRLAGILPAVSHRSNFAPIRQIPKSDGDECYEETRAAINEALQSMPDPAREVEWMTDEIRASVQRYDRRLDALNAQVAEIEHRAMMMTRMLKEVVQESQSACSRAEAAARTLRGVYDAHQKIQGKLEILRGTMFAEQRNTRLVLLIGLLVAFLGAWWLYWL